MIMKNTVSPKPQAVYVFIKNILFSIPFKLFHSNAKKEMAAFEDKRDKNEKLKLYFFDKRLSF